MVKGMSDRSESGPVLPDEPEGWHALQEKLRDEKDPKKFAELVDQVNRLLTEWEKKNTTKDPKSRPERTDSP